MQRPLRRIERIVDEPPGAAAFAAKTMETATSSERKTTPKLSQRELLGLILSCAVNGSASFSQALHAARGAAPEEDARALTRELLSDLSIRGWIELRKPGPVSGEVEVPRIHYELELAADRNWDDANGDRTRYVLTEKGRAQVGPLLAELRNRGRD